MLQCYRKLFKRKPEAVIVYPCGREVCVKTTKAGREEYLRRTLEMWKRQRYLCPVCTMVIGRSEVSFDHEDPRRMGGGFRDDRIMVNGYPKNFCTHLVCNSHRGSKRNLSHTEAA